MPKTPLPPKPMFARTASTVTSTVSPARQKISPAEKRGRVEALMKARAAELVSAAPPASLTSYRRGEVPTASITVRLPIPLIEKIDARKAKDGVTRSEAIRRMLED